jgi:ABC-type lipoprotein release transport system permease subunit
MSGSPNPSRESIWRMVGVGALGLVGGALLALFVQDLLAAAFVRNGRIPVALRIVFAYLIPVLAIITAVASVVIDARRAARPMQEVDPDD